MTDAETPTRLKRGITGPLLFAFILGDVLGAGIYALMGVLAAEVGAVLFAVTRWFRSRAARAEEASDR
ncbi:hypothetical protein AYL44_12820 [Microbacterium oleivorans]|uniref:Uncharacterized protein n=1 Tax=Microbacterium oleivorans TaxID=273677 RepID=A0A177K662_9MICO|nr:hypothetical protein AYL44_12820 [Microbacterium oleivorans]